MTIKLFNIGERILISCPYRAYAPFMDTNIYLCGQTALEVWQLVRCLWKPHLDQLLPLSSTFKQLHIPPARIERIETCKLTPGQTRQRVAECLERLCDSLVRYPLHTAGRPIGLTGVDPAPAVDAIVNGAPLELMAGSQADRRNGQSRRFRVFSGPIPDGLFVNLGNGVCITTPRHTLAQVASGHTRAELAMLTYELRGAYATNSFAKTHAERCLPMSGEHDLIELLPTAIDTRGIAALRRVLPLTLDHAASVIEAGMVLLLCAPRHLGGYGFPMPEMNSRLPVPPTLRNIVDWPWVACDALWRNANVVLEYDGREHDEASISKRDKRRKNVLSTLGLNVHTMNAEEFVNVDLFDRTARRVAKCIGYRMEKRDYDRAWESKRAALRTEVLKLTKPSNAILPRGIAM